ncbi:hypothetical protein [Streptomyces sp. NPDC088350]|uniref:hypothetical protein n=1 Tax=Streptomyces sp. NPDC088350 TaxID=3365854 RepID=UPI0038142091
MLAPPVRLDRGDSSLVPERDQAGEDDGLYSKHELRARPFVQADLEEIAVTGVHDGRFLDLLLIEEEGQLLKTPRGAIACRYGESPDFACLHVLDARRFH